MYVKLKALLQALASPKRAMSPDGKGETKDGTSELDRIRWDRKRADAHQQSKMRKTVKINGYDFDALIDTGSTITLIRESVHQILGRPTLNPTKINLASFGKSEIKTFGSFKSTIDIEDNKFMTDIYVIDNLQTTIDVIIGTDVLKQTEFKITANEDKCKNLEMQVSNTSTLSLEKTALLDKLHELEESNLEKVDKLVKLEENKRKTKKSKSSGRNANKTSDSDENQALAKEKNVLLRQIDFLNSIILDTKLKEPNKSFACNILDFLFRCGQLILGWPTVKLKALLQAPLASPREGNVPDGERRDEARNIRTRQNPLGPQERQTRISKAVITLKK
ncbi:hypothetical protein TNCV_1972371 [Trichonephila clavipes]|nr:hypothetical protein TNCV_1972371 [Trichonephila clavipes]